MQKSRSFHLRKKTLDSNGRPLRQPIIVTFYDFNQSHLLGALAAMSVIVIMVLHNFFSPRFRSFPTIWVRVKWPCLNGSHLFFQFEEPLSG